MYYMSWVILGFVVGGFPGSFVVHGALARRKFFIITTPTFHINCVLIQGGPGADPGGGGLGV